jgi:hypothetical protein
MQSEGSLTCSRGPTTGLLWAKGVQSTLANLSLSFSSIYFNIILPLRINLRSDLFHLGFPIKILCELLISPSNGRDLTPLTQTNFTKFRHEVYCTYAYRLQLVEGSSWQFFTKQSENWCVHHISVKNMVPEQGYCFKSHVNRHPYGCNEGSDISSYHTVVRSTARLCFLSSSSLLLFFFFQTSKRPTAPLTNSASEQAKECHPWKFESKVTEVRHRTASVLEQKQLSHIWLNHCAV